MDVASELALELADKGIQAIIVKSYDELISLGTMINKVIVVQGQPRSLNWEVSAISSGARGILWTPVVESELTALITSVNNGMRSFSSNAMSRYIDSVQSSRFSALEGVLTKREQEIAKLIVRGLSNKEIALEKKIAVTTAKTHVQNLLRKLGVRNRTELVSRVGFI